MYNTRKIIGRDEPDTGIAPSRVGIGKSDLFFAIDSKSLDYKLPKSKVDKGLDRPAYSSVDYAIDNEIIQAKKRTKIRQHLLESELEILAKKTKFTSSDL